MKVKVNYQEDCVERGVPESDEPYSSRSDTIYRFKVLSVSALEPLNPYFDEIDFDGNKLPDHVYVVWVSYSDGDTFGRSFGHGSIQGVFASYAEALAAQAQIRSTGKGLPIPGKEYTHYAPWDGYFASLEGVEIDAVPVTK
jgi:hypothetical protein